MSDELAEADLRPDAEYEQLASSTGPLPPTNVYRKAKWAIGEIDVLKARVDLLTTALTGVLDAWNDEDADLVNALDDARAVLSAGEGTS